jgi:hypothetical protein
VVEALSVNIESDWDRCIGAPGKAAYPGQNTVALC